MLYGVPDGFRPNETGWWQNDILNHLAPSTELEWIESQNWSSRVISARGCYSSNISSKRFAIIGSGSLGATIAELLVRAGVTHLTCIDGDRLEIGNLCRHTLTMSDLTRQKASHFHPIYHLSIHMLMFQQTHVISKSTATGAFLLILGIMIL